MKIKQYMILNTEKRMKTYKVIAKSVIGAILCTALFSTAVLAANAATSTVSGLGSDLFTPRYLPNIIQGAQGPADVIFFLYKYLMGLVGIVAVGVIMYAGVLYTVSADQGKIRQSHEYIKSALKGIVLLFGAQVLFNTINPNIVDFPRIQKALQPERRFVPVEFTGTEIGFASTTVAAAATQQGAINLYGGARFVCNRGGEVYPNCSTGSVNLANKIQACNDCAVASAFADARFMIKQGACFGAGCQINKGLISTLNNLQTIATASGVQWRMTEGYPPTVNHTSGCHFDGTCVDIGLMGGTSAPTAAKVNAFINAARTAGLNVVNEYPVGENPQSFGTTVGGHLHVRL